MVLIKRSSSEGPTRSTPQAKVSGFRGEAGKRSIAAIAAAHDADPCRIGYVFTDGPGHAVQKIIIHLAAPFLVARIHERLSEAGRAPEIHAQNRVTAIGKPLMHRVIAEMIAGPGATMHEQHHGQGLVWPARVVCIGPLGQGKKRHKVEPVSGLDHDRVHVRERRVSELRPRVEQLREGFCLAVIQIG